MSTSEELYFLPLGGAGEIGMNLNLFGYGDQWIMVDLGVMFGEPGLPGIDIVMPDPSFIVERKDKLLGIVLTHAHEDHFGAVHHLWPQLECPVYATPFTAELLRMKLAEAGLDDIVPVEEVPLGGRVRLGPFEIDYITLTHSIAEPNALAIRTPLGTVFHTGDWKIDPDPVVGDKTDEAALTALGEEGVLAMICDSTNVFNAHASGSEATVRENLIKLIGTLDGRVAVTAFASNIARIHSLAEAAAANGRHAVLVGRSMIRNVGVAKATGYLQDLPPFVSEQEAGFLPPDKVMFICTGSQGEPRGAMARIASGGHNHVQLSRGDTVIFSSKIIPGNELSLSALHNALAEQGIHVITEKDEFVHVSGHPGRSELTQMYQWIRPQIAVPVHGEPRHLFEHGALAEELQVPQTVVPRNGTLVRLAPGPAEIVETVRTGRMVLDGDMIVPHDGESIVERRRGMYNGHLVVSLALEEDGELASAPGLTLFGVPRNAEIEKRIGAAVELALDKLSAKAMKDEDVVYETARIAARRACRELTGKRAQTDVQILRLPAFE